MVNGTIGKQMVDMLVESSNNVEMILKFFDMFLKLKDLTSSDAFKEYDPDAKGKALPFFLDGLPTHTQELRIYNNAAVGRKPCIFMFLLLFSS